ncbi:MAG: hypothetical protein Q9166_004166 [cf. Caloplaca sp. 2 TL-2023]
MDLDIDFENTGFDEQVHPTIIDQMLIKLAMQHNTHAYNQCPKCLSASQSPSAGTLKRTEPISHPSTCRICQTLIRKELADLEQQRRALQPELNSMENPPVQPTDIGKDIITTLDFLKERTKVIKEQLREPCSYSIPIQAFMKLKQPQYRSLQAERFDPRYSPHEHQGAICNFGGKVKSVQWEAANLVLRRGMTVMPGLREQKGLVKVVWLQGKELERQRERQKERKRQAFSEG